MPNNKPIGVAYADPALADATIATSTITGGTINATPIGGTTPAAVAGTTVSGTSGYTTSATTGAVASNATGGFYLLSTAITADTTTTTAPVGSFGVTAHATGRGKLFYSDGTKWQLGAIT
jgi:hypothetical protein